jgi:hypothetical protein
MRRIELTFIVLVSASRCGTQSHAILSLVLFPNYKLVIPFSDSQHLQSNWGVNIDPVRLVVAGLPIALFGSGQMLLLLGQYSSIDN